MSNRTAFGQKGVLLKEANTATGNYVVLMPYEDSSVTTEVNWENAGATETLTLTAGVPVYGVFTNVVWVSGYVVAYE